MPLKLPANIDLLIKRVFNDLNEIWEKKRNNKSFYQVLEELGYLKDELAILDIAFNNCDIKQFEQLLANYLHENYIVENIGTKVNMDSSIILKKALLIIQFLTKTSHGKLNHTSTK